MPGENNSVSIITIGDELLIGQTIDTNSAWIGQLLNKHGYWVRRRIAVGDDRNEIIDALKQESAASGVIILTGGLGPTADDITKPTLCEYFECNLVIDQVTKQRVTDLFEKKFRKPVTERNLKQAEIPESCTILTNNIGSAPGMWFEKNGVIYISLPGVPHEMKGIMKDEVEPRLIKRDGRGTVEHRTLLAAGQGESYFADLLVDFEKALPTSISLAYLPGYGMVRLRLTMKNEKDNAVLDKLFNDLKTLIGEYLVSDRDEPMEMAIMHIFKEKQLMLTLAESCSGGYISKLFTQHAGASEVFLGGVVSYANELKVKLLGVKPSTLEEFGAVSRETALEMLSGVLNNLGGDYAIAVTGIMGPEGGTPEKPVGTVWIAVGSEKNVECKKLQFPFNRERNIEMTAYTALNMLRLLLRKN